VQPDFPAELTPPASTPAVAVPSGGVELPGVLHLPAGPGPHPVVVLLHGFPGTERNFDLAQLLRRAGYAALVFHYRGSWGAGGSWSWGNVLQDAAAAIAFVRSAAPTHRLDAERVALVGHSLGGFAALMTAAADPAIPVVASITCFDFGRAALACADDPVVRAGYVEAFDASLLPLRGTSGAALVAEMIDAGPGWQLAGLAPHIAVRPVLLIGAGRDTDAPAQQNHWPLVRAYTDHPVPHLEHHLFPTDHALSDHRRALGDTVLAFLGTHFPARAPMSAAV
jgi:pimeloyl-ACP methyl ester carboxylesterase